MKKVLEKTISIISQNKSIIFILILASFLRFYHLGVESYWVDEGQSINYVLNFKEYLRKYFTGVESNHPPFYYTLLYLWSFLGNDEFTSRSLSLIFGILSIGIIYLAVKNWYGRKTAIIASLLLTFSTFHIQYCQEVREYTFHLLFSFLGIYSFTLYLKEKDNKKLFYLFIFSVLGFWSHHFYIFTFLYLNLIYLILFKKENLKLKNWLIVQILIILTTIPNIIPIFISFFLPVVKGGTTHIDWLKPPNIYSLKDLIISDLSSTNFLLYNQNISTLIRKFIKFIFLFLFFLGVFNLPYKNNSNLKIHLILIGYLIFYIATVYLISIYFKPIFLSRYFIPLLPVYLLILANGIERLKITYLKYLILIIILILSSISFHTYLTAKELKKDQYREAAYFIQNQEEIGDFLCISSHWVGLTFNYYYKGNLERGYFSNIQKNKKLLQKIINKYKRLWLVLSNTGVCINEDMNRFIEANYPNNFKKIKEINLVKVNLYLYEIIK